VTETEAISSTRAPQAVPVPARLFVPLIARPGTTVPPERKK